MLKIRKRTLAKDLDGHAVKSEAMPVPNGKLACPPSLCCQSDAPCGRPLDQFGPLHVELFSAPFDGHRAWITGSLTGLRAARFQHRVPLTHAANKCENPPSHAAGPSLRTLERPLAATERLTKAAVLNNSVSGYRRAYGHFRSICLHPMLDGIDSTHSWTNEPECEENGTGQARAEHSVGMVNMTTSRW
jgi:hypothetical protein